MGSHLLSPILANARRDPDAVAIIAPDGTATYGGLIARAQMFARAYHRQGVTTGDRVAVVLPPGRDAMAAALGALLMRAAYVLIGTDQPPLRRSAILATCGARLCVESPDALVGPWSPDHAVNLDEVTVGSGRDIAVVTYTSGSAGSWTETTIEHRHLVRLLAAVDAVAPAGAGVVGAWWGSPDLDSTTWEMWSPLRLGGRVAVPVDGVRAKDEEVGWFLHEAGVTSACVPAELVPALVRHAEENPDATGLLTRLLVGPGAVRRGPLQSLLRTLPGLDIVTVHGAPGGVWYALGRVAADEDDPAPFAPIGSAVPGQRLVLAATRGSSGTGTGELTVMSDDPAAALVHTGDLVSQGADGRLYLTGRTDRRLLIRGRWIDSAEVEAAVAAELGARDVSVELLRRGEDEPTLVALVAGRSPASLPSRGWLRDRLGRKLPPTAIPVVVTALPQLAGDDLGAFDRVEPDDVMPGDEPTVPPSAGDDEVTNVLRAVRRAWMAEIGTSETPGGFVESGGTSLGAVRLAAALCDATGRSVSARDILLAQSLADLAHMVAAAPTQPRYRSAVVGRTVGRLSIDQLGIWMHDRLDPQGRRYVEAQSFLCGAELDVDRLATAVGVAAAAHPSLGAMLDGSPADEPRLVLGRHVGRLSVLDLPAGTTDDQRDAIVRRDVLRPFDLAGGPLFRATLVRVSGRPSLVVFAWHHLIVDGWSVRLFLADVTRCYRDPHLHLAPSSFTVCDAAELLRRRSRAAEVTTRAEQAAAALDDFPLRCGAGRPVGDAAGEPIEIAPAPSLAKSLRSTSQRTGLIPYAFVCAAYEFALVQVLGTDRLVIGCATADREEPGLAQLTGYFVNTMLVRSALGSGPPALDVVVAFNREIADARTRHEGVPFAFVVSSLRRAERSLPLSMPEFYLTLDEDYLLDLAGVPTSPHPIRLRRAKFDVTLMLVIGPLGLRGHLEYRTRLLSDSAARQLVDVFMERLRELLVAVSGQG